MSLFDDLKARLPGLARPGVSPQGWQDELEEWPANRSGRSRPTLRRAFSTPSEAVDRVIELLESLSLKAGTRFSRQEAARTMSNLAHTLAALQIQPAEAARRKGTYGRLVHALVQYLPALPWLLRKTPLAEAIRELEALLGDCLDEGLMLAADQLEKSCLEAVETMDFLLRPGLEVAPPAAHDIPPGSSPPAPGPAPTPRPASRAASQGASRSGDRPLPVKPHPPAMPSLPGPDSEADLTREKIYRCLLEECMKDGKLSAGEEESILLLRRTLGIPIHRHAAMVREVMAAHNEGRLKGDEEMKLPEFYERIYTLALEDGVITDDERQLLRTVAHLLGVTEAEIASVEARIQPAG